MPETDSQLVLRTLDGDNAAFDELVERYRARAFRAAISGVGIREDAIDVTQEAFVRAYMSLSSLSEPEKFGAWLMAIVANQCKMRLRGRRELAVPSDVLDSIEAPAPDPTEAYEALSSLPVGSRAAATLFFVEGLKQSEIAERLSISLPAVKGRIREARLRLQKEMIEMAPRSKAKDELGDEFTTSLKHKLELARWYREIGEHCGSGGDVMTGLNAILKGDYSAIVLEATERMIDAIESGRTMTEALAELPALATPEASALIRAGEDFGSLHVSAQVLSNWLDVQDAQRRIEVIFWCRTFGFLLSAGVPILEALNHGVDIARSKALQQATHELVQAVEETRTKQPTRSPLRPVLDKYTDIFPPVLRAAVLAGEWTATLDLALFWAGDAMADDLATSIASSPVGPLRELGPRRQYRPEIIEMLKGSVRLLADDDPDIREGAIDILGRLEHKEAAPEILARLDDDSPQVRNMAARVLTQLGCMEAEGGLIKLLQDAEPIVRRTAVESITKLELHSAASALAEAIRDSDHRVIIAAIEALQALKETNVMKQKAIEMLGSESWEDQKRAGYLLRYFLPEEVRQGLISSLETKGEELSPIEANAVIALGLYGCPEARPLLNRMVADSRFSKRAARALEECGDASSAAAIRAAIESGVLDAEMARVAEKLKV